MISYAMTKKDKLISKIIRDINSLITYNENELKEHFEYSAEAILTVIGNLLVDTIRLTAKPGRHMAALDDFLIEIKKGSEEAFKHYGLTEAPNEVSNLQH